MDRRLLLLLATALVVLTTVVLYPRGEDPAENEGQSPAVAADEAAEVPLAAAEDPGADIERTQISVLGESPDHAPVAPGNLGLGSRFGNLLGSPPRTLRGRVISDEQGIGGATVAVYTSLGFGRRVPKDAPIARAQTNAAGEFEVQVAAADVQLVALAPGFGPKDYMHLSLDSEHLDGGAAASSSAAAAAAETVIEGLLLEIYPLQELHGQVLAGGVPIADAKVELEISQSWTRSRPGPVRDSGYRALQAFVLRSDEVGNFRKQVPAANYWVRAEHESHGKGEVQDVETPIADLVVELKVAKEERGSSIHGLVVDPGGTAIAGAQVRFAAEGPQTITHSDGGFELDKVKKHWALEAEVLAWAPGFAPNWVMLGELQPLHSSVEVVLAPAFPIEGMLQGADGNPLARGRVFLSGEREYHDGTSPANTILSSFVDPVTKQELSVAVSDDQGNFRFAHVPAGEYTLTYRGPGRNTGFYDDARATVGAVGGSRGVILRDGQFDAPQVIFRGRVTDRYSGESLPGATLTANRITRSGAGGWSASGVESGTSDADGGYQIRGLEKGEYYLTLKLQGYADTKTQEAEYLPGDFIHDFQPVPERTLHLTVLDAAGNPAARASVMARDADGTSMMIKLGGGSAVSPGRTDDRGELIMHGMPAASITLECWLEWYQPRETHTLDLRLPGPHEYEMRLGGVPLQDPVQVRLRMQLADGGAPSVGGLDPEHRLVASAYDLEGRLVSQESMWPGDSGWIRLFGQVEREVSEPVLVLHLPAAGGRIEVEGPGYERSVVPVGAVEPQSTGARDLTAVLRPRD